VTAVPTTVDEARTAAGEYRAGGTDLQARLDAGVATGPPVDLRGIPQLDAVEWDEDGRARIGALVTIAAVATDERLAAAYPGFTRAAAALATPQVRTAGTVGGNLLQRNRCWYFRNPAVDCLQKTGDDCPARAGNHLLGVCFDLGPCVAPHASTLGMALLAYEA
jgi:xanthine dehydrogenase YagS FAD-binding subunit